MQIHWFTLLAQAVNFLVLVLLLKRFLYGPIVRAMDAREALIASRLQEADEKRAAAEQEIERYRAQNQTLAEERAQRLAQAEQEAVAHRQQLVEEARQEVRRLRAEWFESLRNEKQQFMRTFREKAGQQIFTMVRCALKDLAGAELEPQVVSAFLAQLETLPPAERDLMAEAIRASDREVVLRSAFPLSAEMRARITKSFRDHLNEGVVVRFELEPTLGCGIELVAHSRELAWNLKSYVDALEDSFLQNVEEKAKEHGEPEQERSEPPDAPSACDSAG